MPYKAKNEVLRCKNLPIMLWWRVGGFFEDWFVWFGVEFLGNFFETWGVSRTTEDHCLCSSRSARNYVPESGEINTAKHCNHHRKY